MTRWASYNEVVNKLEDAKQFATFTLPSACWNPVWARFENATGTNIFNSKSALPEWLSPALTRRRNRMKRAAPPERWGVRTSSHTASTSSKGTTIHT